MPDDRTPDDPPVLHERRGPVAHVTMNRPRYRNAQNSAMTYALDDACYRAAEDPEVKVVVLAGAGEHFSAGHDIGSPGRDAHLPFERRPGLWWDHTGRPGAESRFARESEVYPGMCRRRREPPKPVIARDRMAARRAYEVGMVNRVVPDSELAAETERPALRIQAEDLQGLHTGMDSVFGPHHLAHAHNAETAADSLGGVDIAALKEANT